MPDQKQLSKSDERRVESLRSDNPPAKYRYYCDACTGTAFKSNAKLTTNTPTNCENCGHKIGTIKEENYINL